MPHVFTPVAREPDGAWALLNARNHRVLATRLLPAFDSASRRAGLLGRASLGEGEAMIIAPTSGVHTFFMRFPIDIAFVDRRGAVLRTCHVLRPWRIALSLRAFAAVEMPAGMLERCETRPGDALIVVPRSA